MFLCLSHHYNQEEKLRDQKLADSGVRYADGKDIKHVVPQRYRPCPPGRAGMVTWGRVPGDSQGLALWPSTAASQNHPDSLKTPDAGIPGRDSGVRTFFGVARVIPVCSGGSRSPLPVAW